MGTVHVWVHGHEDPHFPTKEGAAKSIQAGIDEACKQGPGSTVIVWGDCKEAPGGRCTYFENVRITIAGIEVAGANYPIVDGGGNDRVFTFLPNQSAVTVLSGFEIINGKSDKHGAGVYVRDAAAIITNNCIHGNDSLKTGGGIAVEYTSEATYFPTYIEANAIYGNQAVNGGGVGVIGVTVPYITKSLDSVVFINRNEIGSKNEARGIRDGKVLSEYAHGGGISVFCLPVRIDGNYICDNQAHKTPNNQEGYGGGICVYNVDDTSAQAKAEAVFKIMAKDWYDFAPVQVVITDNTIVFNESNYKGGGVAGIWAAQVLYHGNYFEENTAAYNGGAVYGTTRATNRFDGDNTIRSNYANGPLPNDGDGGGVHISCKARVIFTGNNIVERNVARRHGGGISLHHGEFSAEDGVLLVSNNIATHGHGGGIHATDKLVGSDLDPHVMPCNRYLAFDLESAIVEENHSALDGGGIALVQELNDLGMAVPNFFDPGKAKRVNITRSVVRANKTDRQVAGVLLSQTASGNKLIGFNVHHLQVEDHDPTGSQIGIKLVDKEYATSFIDSVWFRNNGTGLHVHDARVSVYECTFEKNASDHFAISGHRAHVYATRNDFIGGGTTKRAISAASLRDKPFKPPVSIDKCNFDGHKNFAIENVSSIDIAADDCFWGDPNGPTTPTTPPALKRGDKVSAHVTIGPIAGQANATGRAGWALNRPALGWPQSPIVPECELTRGPPAETQRPPPPPGIDEPRPPGIDDPPHENHETTPGGGSDHGGGGKGSRNEPPRRRRSEGRVLRFSTRTSGGLEYPALMLPTGHAVVLGVSDQSIGVLAPDGSFNRAHQPIAAVARLSEP